VTSSPPSRTGLAGPGCGSTAPPGPRWLTLQRATVLSRFRLFVWRPSTSWDPRRGCRWLRSRLHWLNVSRIGIGRPLDSRDSLMLCPHTQSNACSCTQGGGRAVTKSQTLPLRWSYVNLLDPAVRPVVVSSCSDYSDALSQWLFPVRGRCASELPPPEGGGFVS